jgi:polyferredoxin
MKPGKKPNYIRIGFQGIIFILLVYMLLRPLVDKKYVADFEAYCPFGGMQALGSFFSSNALACSMTTTQIALGIALLLGVILLSKLFCSYVCPVGSITEWIGSWARKLKMQFTLKGWFDRSLRLLKYVLLFISFYFSVTSSELFCKKFDPYYAAFTGFSSDVVWYYAVPALVLTLIGSFFIRQFWCKYLCPLGAITNLAVYALPAVSIILLWVLLNSAFNLSISWVWMLGAICLLGFILEATTLKFLVFPPLRITRNNDICTNCRICDKKCPMALEVSTVDKVNHIDCHLCTDCIVKCPEKGALSINKRSLNWLPATATVLFAVAAILLSIKYELPTISERWTDPQGLSNATVFEMSGLKSIKCFGSSRSFANQMKEVEGVLGVETFVKHHKVKVYYDEELTNAEKLRAAIFSPMSDFIAAPPASLSTISTMTLGIDRCFDPNDQYLLSDMMRQQKGIFAMETAFGEPVQATFFYDSTLLKPADIISWIEQKSVTFGEGENQYIQEADFIVNKNGRMAGRMAKVEFLARFFEVRDVSFNKFNTYKAGEFSRFNMSFPAAIDLEMQQWIPYLISHFSNNDGIVRFQTVFTSSDPELVITYVTKMTNPEQIRKMIEEPELLVHYPDKSVKKVKNPFR